MLRLSEHLPRIKIKAGLFLKLGSESIFHRRTKLCVNITSKNYKTQTVLGLLVISQLC